MRPLLSIFVLSCLSLGAAAQGLVENITVHPANDPAISGTGFFDLSVPAAPDGSTPVGGSAKLDSAPPHEVVWMVDLVLGTNWWRWASPEAPAHAATGVSGSYSFDFGQAGILSASYTLDLLQDTGSIDIFLQGVNLGLLPSPGIDEWMIADEASDTDGQGNVSGSGCLLLNGKEVASFTHAGSVSPQLDLSALPPLSVRFGLRRSTTSPDEAIRNGRALLLLSDRFNTTVTGDFGNGPENLANGFFDLWGHTRAREWNISGELQSSGQNFHLMPLTNLGWPNIVGRSLRAPHVWSTDPSVVQGTMTLDFGNSGSVLLTLLVDSAQGVAQFDYDFTGFDHANYAGPSGIYQVELNEGTVGVPGGVLDASGSAEIIVTPVITGTVTLSPQPATSNLPAVQTTVDLTNNLLGQLPTLYFGGVARSDLESSTGIVGTLDLGPTVLTVGGFVAAVPTVVESGTKYDVSGQLVYDQPLPVRAIALTQLPAMASYLRSQASNSSYPTEYSSLHFSDYAIYFQPQGGSASSDVTAEYDIAELSIVNILQNLDLGLLPLLDAKTWVRLQEYGDEGEDGNTEEDGCITICEEDPNTNEILCSAECDVRYAASTGSLPKGGDILFDLTSEILFCLDFAQDEESVDILATFIMDETQQASPVAPHDNLLAMRPPAPNPAAGGTTVQLSLPIADDVRIQVFDLRGRRVQTLFAGPLNAGAHDFRWDGRDMHGRRVAAGNYFLRAFVGGQSLQRKLVLLR